MTSEDIKNEEICKETTVYITASYLNLELMFGGERYDEIEPSEYREDANKKLKKLLKTEKPDYIPTKIDNFTVYDTGAKVKITYMSKINDEELLKRLYYSICYTGSFTKIILSTEKQPNFTDELTMKLNGKIEPNKTPKKEEKKTKETTRETPRTPVVWEA